MGTGFDESSWTMSCAGNYDSNHSLGSSKSGKMWQQGLVSGKSLEYRASDWVKQVKGALCVLTSGEVSREEYVNWDRAVMLQESSQRNITDKGSMSKTGGVSALARSPVIYQLRARCVQREESSE